MTTPIYRDRQSAGRTLAARLGAHARRAASHPMETPL